MRFDSDNRQNRREKLVYYFETLWKRELTRICFIKNLAQSKQS